MEALVRVISAPPQELCGQEIACAACQSRGRLAVIRFEQQPAAVLAGYPPGATRSACQKNTNPVTYEIDLAVVTEAMHALVVPAPLLARPRGFLTSPARIEKAVRKEP